MNDRLKLISALEVIAEQCSIVAKLLKSDVLNNIPHDTIIYDSPDDSISIDVLKYNLWPTAKYSANFPINISDCNVIEYSNGPSVPIAYQQILNCDIDLIRTDCRSFDGNSKCRRLSSFSECNDFYDVGIIYESLEFEKDPTAIISSMARKIKKNGKIFIRFRPWTSKSGGFHEFTINKAYAHLLMSIDSEVINKVTRPLATYERMFSQLKLNIMSRNVISSDIDGFFLRNDDIINTIIKRTWGAMDKSEALRILTTCNVDYVLTIGAPVSPAVRQRNHQ